MTTVMLAMSVMTMMINMTTKRITKMTAATVPAMVMMSVAIPMTTKTTTAAATLSLIS